MSGTALMIVGGALCAVVWFWHASMSARERANRAAQEACERLRLVLLDGTVAITRLWLRRDEHGRLRMERSYGFEYSDDGRRRLRGFVIMLGSRVDSVGLAAARLGDANDDRPVQRLPGN
jgi:hypothetical protein